jgi:hypothetical protein
MNFRISNEDLDNIIREKYNEINTVSVKKHLISILEFVESFGFEISHCKKIHDFDLDIIEFLKKNAASIRLINIMNTNYNEVNTINKFLKAIEKDRNYFITIRNAGNRSAYELEDILLHYGINLNIRFKRG